VVIASGYKDPRRNPTHYGVDLAGKLGDVVRAPEHMTIVATAIAPDSDIADNTNFEACRGLRGGLLCQLRDRKWSPWTGYGPGVVVGHGDSGRFHLLAHLGSVNVVDGQEVNEGDPIGAMASHVGNAGTHTHWEVRSVAVDEGPRTRERFTVDPVAFVGGPVALKVAELRAKVEAAKGRAELGALVVLLVLWRLSR
jgi:murein DD-endopeptidase MepM/ murein hydrolase activator NlpD